jgi:hypothetical protein
MSKTDSKAPLGIGFLTVIQAEALGRIGGLLVLNQRGRPTEFHCTSPVKPNRAQEILYGPTLDDYLDGEQIARTLVERLSGNAWLLCTDLPSVLAVRPFSKIPVCFVHSQGAAVPEDAMSLGGVAVSLPPGGDADRSAILEGWSQHVDSFDLREPFERIYEALREAQRGMAA